jgi:hypothetical protein
MHAREHSSSAECRFNSARVNPLSLWLHSTFCIQPAFACAIFPFFFYHITRRRRSCKNVRKDCHSSDFDSRLNPDPVIKIWSVPASQIVFFFFEWQLFGGNYCDESAINSPITFSWGYTMYTFFLCLRKTAKRFTDFVGLFFFCLFLFST